MRCPSFLRLQLSQTCHFLVYPFFEWNVKQPNLVCPKLVNFGKHNFSIFSTELLLSKNQREHNDFLTTLK